MQPERRTNIIIGDKDKKGNTLILGGRNSDLYLTPEGYYLIEGIYSGEESEALRLYNEYNGTSLTSLPKLPTKPKELEGISLPFTTGRILGVFESNSNPGTYHYVILSLKGNITCTCFGFRSPDNCWHYRSIMEIGPENIKEPIVVKLKDLEGV